MRRIVARPGATRPWRLLCILRPFRGLFVNWDYIRDGMSAAEAGVGIGVSARARRKWFADGGGVKPEFTDDKPCKWSRLPLEERLEIKRRRCVLLCPRSARDPDTGSGS
jgi:hypothetical protein